MKITNETAPKTPGVLQRGRFNISIKKDAIGKIKSSTFTRECKKIIFLMESGQSSILSILKHRTHFQTMNSNLFTDSNLVAYFSQAT